MGFLSKLNALAQDALGGAVDRLDDWRIRCAPERTDYKALWQEAVSACHPIVDERIRLRVREQNTENSYACREAPVTGQLDALDQEAKAALVVEMLKRYVFLDYCVSAIVNRNNEHITRLENFGIERNAVIALRSDFENLTRHLLGRSGPKLDTGQTEAVARIVGFMAGEQHLSWSTGSLLSLITPVLCDAKASLSDQQRVALARLFRVLGERTPPISHETSGVLDLVRALAHCIGVAPEAHPIMRAKIKADDLREEGKQAVIDLAGPRLAGFFKTGFESNAFNSYSHRYVKDKADLSALDALSAHDNAVALFDCLRVFNFTERCGKHPNAKPWPACKLSGFNPADHPRMADYRDDGYFNYYRPLLESLFQHIARRKSALDEEMQWELLALLRGEAAPSMLQSLQVVKIIEGLARDNASARVRGELAATIDWLRGRNDHYTRKFKAAALHRLESALASMAGGAQAAARSEASREPTAQSERSAEAGPLPPFPIPDRFESAINAITDFYGDLADLRKCTPEHIAVIDELIQRDADPEAELHRALKKEVQELKAQGMPRDQVEAVIGIKLLSAQGRLQPGRYRDLFDLLRTRMETAARFDQNVRAIWLTFHAHARALYGKSKPTAAWIKEAHAILAGIQADHQVELVKTVVAGFPLRGSHLASDEAIRGLVYCAAQLPADKVGPAIASFAQKECFQTVPGCGIRDKRMGNACLWSLINMPNGKGVPYLARLLNRIKYPSVKKTINAALDEAAANAGMSRGTLDELSVPTHDLEDGKLEIAVGPDGGAAILKIVGTANVAISFKRPDGEETASVPAVLKQFKAEITGARATSKEIEADLTTQIARLQQIWLQNRDWSFTDWDARYASHPLMAQLTARLIWNVGDGASARAAILVDGALQGLDGTPVDPSDSRISLWHPIGRPVEEVLAWRKRLAKLEIVQPFKQAHREVYYVTDAERATATYSNRFAGHILRQHQMMNLARLNNWNVTHRIWADVPNDEPTHLVIPAWNIAAELWTKGAGGDDPEVADSQAYAFISTDQVRFYSIAGGAETSAPTARGPARGEAIRMEAVPEIVFSEVMRHCDLFTSVASVSNDPNWIDSGANAQHPSDWRRAVAEGYWRDTAFGELAPSAQSRKEVLKEVLPALKLADKCSIDGNYLRVQGKIRAYKIHLGSGNILMEPDSRYLCIVRAPAKDDRRVMLPFEGDGMLPVILSKALLLAADDKITDEIIIRQIFR